jgi:pyruvate, orthophosphate dikinase
MSELPRLFFISRHDTDAPAIPSVVGNKAAGLIRLNHLKLHVPPALVLSAAACREYAERGALPDGVLTELADAIHRLERATDLVFGGREPLIVSVRASPPMSMPGMLKTVLNIGLTERTVPGLIRRTGNPWLAWDAYRRLIRSFAQAGCDAAPELFDQQLSDYLAKAGVTTIQDLDALSLRNLARESTDLANPPRDLLPQDPFTQLVTAIEAVFASWNAPHARTYRRLAGLDDKSGTAVVIQTMVFGNAGSRSGSGAAFTRNPSTGDDELYVDFAFCTQGEVVDGPDGMLDGARLPELLPEVWTELRVVKGVLEREFLDVQDFEFTVEEGRLFLLQTRDGKRTPWAALNIAVDLVREGLIHPSAAVRRLTGYDVDNMTRLVAAPGDVQPIARATPASLGLATGRIAFDTEGARDLARAGPVVLVRPRLTTADFAAFASAAGIVSASGGRTSHAAVIAREQGKVCLVGCRDLHVNEGSGTCTFGARAFREGDLVTIDGQDGRIYAGAIPSTVERPTGAIARVAEWQREMVNG